MNIQRAITNARGHIVGNEPVAKVSEAEANDTIFVSKEEREAGMIAKVDALLASRNLKVVDRFKETKTGSLRSFIGDANYTAPVTELA